MRNGRGDGRDLDSRLERLSPERRAYLARLLERRRDAGPPEKRALAPRRTRADEPLPLSFAQSRLWFLEQLRPGDPFYVIRSSIELPGAVDGGVLEAALDEVVRRHEILRTTFAAHEGVPQQVVAAQLHLPLERLDLSALGSDAARLEAARLTVAEAERPFDLERGPLLRVRLLQIGPDEHVLLLAMHHIVTDGWSMGVLFRELRELYAAFSAGRPSPLPELPIQYADFALWQRERLAGARLEAELAYWRARLADLRVLELPADRPRPAVSSHRGGSLGVRLDEKLTAELRRFAKTRGATPFMVLLAGFAWLLHRASGQLEVVLGAPMAGRGQAELEGLIGFFVNSLVLRLDCSGDPSFAELVDRTRGVVVGALAHQELPFERLVEELQPQRDLGRNPLFQVTFQLQQGSSQDGETRPGACEGEPEAVQVLGERGSVGFDLSVDVWETPRSLQARFEYSRELFEAATVAALAQSWRQVLSGALAAPERPLGELALLAPEQERAVLAAAQGPVCAFPEDRCLHELVAEQACRTPEAPALRQGSWQLSYAELERRANRLAWRLRRLGVGPETLVGVALERSAALVIALLGVLKAGGAYLPLDPRDPPARLNRLLERFAVPLLIASHAPELPAAVRLLEASSLAELRCSPLEADPDDAPVPPSGVTPCNLAYVITTSGSTGEPKGVEVEHRSLVNLVAWHVRRYEVTSADRAPLLSSTVFDASVWELWPYLAAGAEVVVASDETRLSLERLVRWLIGERVTVCFIITSLGVAALEAGLAEATALRHLLLGGEALGAPPRGPLPFTVHNHYGPTEATVVATAGEQPTEPAARVTLGRPIANVEAYVLDERGRLLPPGVPGELYLGGAGLARGYRLQPESTARAFVPHPFAAGKRLYRTGDRVRWTADYRLHFLGRLDDQLKVRGYRIEPAEVEAALAAHRSIAQAAVAAHDGLLVGYVTLRSAAPHAAAPQPEALRAWLAERLPAHFVPGAIVVLDALPRTSGGKLDRRALPRPELGSARSEPPRTETERRIAGIWQEVLALPQVGRQDGFFELGGHSLLAMRLVARMTGAFGIEVPIHSVFEAPDLAALALLVDALLAGARGPLAAAIRQASRERYRAVRGELGELVFPDAPAAPGAACNPVERVP